MYHQNNFYDSVNNSLLANGVQQNINDQIIGFSNHVSENQIDQHQRRALTINTSVPNTIPQHYIGLSTNTPTSPIIYGANIRRRNTYTTGEVGPFFSQTKQSIPIWNSDKSRNIKFNVQAKVDKGFFLTESDWTCYRRNYFQVSGAFNAYTISNAALPLETPLDFNPNEHQCFIEMNSSLLLISGFRIGVSSRIASSEKIIDLIQHTSKRDKGPQSVPSPKPVRAGGNLVQNQLQHFLASAQLGSSFGNYSIATFERLQFKSATANNGKRRAAQQYYVIDVELYADFLSNDNSLTSIKIASTTSAPLVVRGRSPGHYSDGEKLQSPYSMIASTSGSSESNMIPSTASVDALNRFNNYNPQFEHRFISTAFPNLNSQTDAESSIPSQPFFDLTKTQIQDFSTIPANLIQNGNGGPASGASSLFSSNVGFSSLPSVAEYSPSMYSAPPEAGFEQKLAYESFNELSESQQMINF